MINWKHQEDVQRCFFSSGRTVDICRPLGDREARDAASSSCRIQRKISSQTSSVHFSTGSSFQCALGPNPLGLQRRLSPKSSHQKAARAAGDQSAVIRRGQILTLWGGKRHHTPIFSPSAVVSTIDFAAVSCDRRTNDSNLIKSASTQKHAVKILDTVFHQLGCEWFYFISFFMN